jgi:membrane protein DedA with SNARE-associated domain
MAEDKDGTLLGYLTGRRGTLPLTRNTYREVIKLREQLDVIEEWLKEKGVTAY